VRSKALGEVIKHKDMYPRPNMSEMVIATGNSGMLHGDTEGKQEKISGRVWLSRNKSFSFRLTNDSLMALSGLRFF